MDPLRRACLGECFADGLFCKLGGNGFALIGVYTLGFVIPFLAVGLFTSTLLDFFKKHQKVVKYTVKAGGILMILMGVMMITGWMNGVTGYLSSFGGTGTAQLLRKVHPRCLRQTANPHRRTAALQRLLRRRIQRKKFQKSQLQILH